MKKIILLFCVLLSGYSYGEPCSTPEGLAELKPDYEIRYQDKLNGYSEGSCAVFVFKLEVRDRSGGRNMKPRWIELYSSSDKKFAKDAKKVLKKWVFLTKNVNPKGQYFAVLEPSKRP